MNMSQSGGFVLTGIKLCPVTGHNELDDDLLKELRGLVGGRRGRKAKNKTANDGSKTRRKKKKGGDLTVGRDSKRSRLGN